MELASLVSIQGLKKSPFPVPTLPSTIPRNGPTRFKNITYGAV